MSSIDRNQPEDNDEDLLGQEAVRKIKETEGYYWDTKHGTAVAGVQMLIGAVLRKTMDDSVQGKLDVCLLGSGNE
jgi:hypothetical protein